MPQSSPRFLKNFVFLLIGLVIAFPVSAVSFSLLKGNGFRDDLGYRPDKTTLTIENFAVWELGTVFFYYDLTEPTTHDGQPRQRKDAFSNQFFGGISPTASLSKITGRDLSVGFLKDVSLRVELENGSGNGNYNFQNYFYGFQYDVAVPGFDFVSLNTVLRDNPRDPYLTTQPQLLYDVGYGLWGKPIRFEVGFEYVYFLNRFQQKDKDEKVLQYMTKISF